MFTDGRNTFIESGHTILYITANWYWSYAIWTILWCISKLCWLEDPAIVKRDMKWGNMTQRGSTVTHDYVKTTIQSI